MNKNIQRLCDISAKQTRKIIGLMSGTSMDGLDIALCEISGSGIHTVLEVHNFKTIPYSSQFRQSIKDIFAKRDADLQAVCLMHAMIGITHAKMINEALKFWNINNTDIDLIASHGQTIYHAPAILHKEKGKPNATLQIGDGDHIAVHTGICTVSDFRQKHVAAGGEGAPLAVYGDYLLFTKLGEDRILLNIGGIANFTYLPKDADASKIFSTDVGPGNTLMDQYMQINFNKNFDKDAEVGKSGKVNSELLSVLLSDAFFDECFPKTTGPELFNLKYLEESQQKSKTEKISKPDVVCTLCAFSAKAIANAIYKCFSPESRIHIYASGGGMHNPLLLKFVQDELPNAVIQTTAKLNVNPDAKEAVLFALLANETVAGEPIDFGNRTSVPPVTMGKISFPS